MGESSTFSLLRTGRGITPPQSVRIFAVAGGCGKAELLEKHVIFSFDCF